MCYVRFSQHTAIKRHKPIFFVIEMQCVYCEWGIEFLSEICIHVNLDVRTAALLNV